MLWQKLCSKALYGANEQAWFRMCTGVIIFLEALSVLIVLVTKPVGCYCTQTHTMVGPGSSSPTALAKVGSPRACCKGLHLGGF